MDIFWAFLPIILMIVTGYFIFKYYKKKNINDGLTDDEKAIWLKARFGLFFIIPFIGVFDIINNNSTGGKPNLFPTIMNFFITSFIVKKMIKKGVNFKYPKLISIGISIGVFILQMALGVAYAVLFNDKFN